MSVFETDGSPGNFIPTVTCVAFGVVAARARSTQTSCGKTAVSGGKFQVIWSPVFSARGVRDPLVARGVDVDVLAAGPPGGGIVAPRT